MENIVKFSVNDWEVEKDYPSAEPFLTWLYVDNFEDFLMNDKWCKDNKICVKWCIIDMSFNFCITATYDWVKMNCPSILNSKFCYSNNSVRDRFGIKFLDYCEENFGSIDVELEEEFFDKKV